MRTRLHLVSMPLAYQLHPSCQLGYLHAFVEQRFQDAVPVTSHSAFWEILYNFAGGETVEFYVKYRFSGEELFFLLNALVTFPRSQLLELLQACNEARDEHTKITEDMLVELREVVESYLDDHVIANLGSEGIDVVGFSTTFSQLFASIFATNYIRRGTDRPVMFLFGGASMSLPEASRTLTRWGVDALMVAGNGEPPLEQILQICLDAPPDMAVNQLLETIERHDLVNVTRAGSVTKPINLAMPKGLLQTLPLPNYDEFFASLRASCEDEAVFRELVDQYLALPLEGSRGCFAKCDFCQIPGITTRFEGMKGESVATRALELCEKYGKHNIVFIDAVCNSWAEDYADTLLAREKTISAFMEMRVHAPEPFWTKLSLSGVQDLQLGIESISGPLLKKMRKGTTVIQNLRVSKYLAELGIKSLSNLMIFHPRSEVADVAETRRLIEILEHFPPFNLSHFEVSYGSPLYTELDPSRRAQLVRGFDWLPEELVDHSFPKDLSYVYPLEWIAPDVAAAWAEFKQWYEALVESRQAEPAIFRVERSGADALHFVDTRFGARREYSLEGASAQIYSLCHDGLTIAEVEAATGHDRASVETIMTDLEARRMMARIGDRYLSVSFRDRAELIANLTGDHRKDKRRPKYLTMVA